MLVAFLLATVTVAFIAGVVALAMPCCFTVLLPAYLAKSFDTVSGRLGMTTVFGAGIATILLPIALGASELSTFLSLNHALLFVVGGFFMVVLGLLSLWGVPMLPARTWDRVDLGRRDAPSVYALGIFSGVASTCCAPVLAGVLVLTVLSGGWLPSLLVGLAYVSGMVFPLLVVATFWDRRAVKVPGFLRGRLVSLRFLRWEWDIHSSKLIAGTLFLAMGAVTIGLGLLGRMLLVPGSSFFGIYEGSLQNLLVAALSDWWVLAILALLGAFGLAFAVAARTGRRGSRLSASKPSRGDAELRSEDLLIPVKTEEPVPGDPPRALTCRGAASPKTPPGDD